MSKILITGGAGFIGSHIVDLLIEHKHTVIIIDNFSSSAKNKLHSKAILYKETVVGNKIEKIFQKEKPDFVIHNAAQIKVTESIKNPLRDAKINIFGTLQLLELSKKYNVKKFLFASSGGAIYGEQKTFATEEANPLPESPYGISKLSAEYYVQHYANKENLSSVILRYSNVYGPRQKAGTQGGVIAIFIDALLQKRPITIYGDGKQTRDFVYVRDIAAINEYALFSDMKGSYNISLRKEITINKLIRTLQKVMRLSKISVKSKSARQGEIRKSKVHNKKFTNYFPSFRFTGLEEGLKETVSYIRKENNG